MIESFCLSHLVEMSALSMLRVKRLSCLYNSDIYIVEKMLGLGLEQRFSKCSRSTPDVIGSPKRSINSKLLSKEVDE